MDKYVTATGLDSETIPSSWDEKAGGRLTYNIDSYKKIEATRDVLKVAMLGYEPLSFKQPVLRVIQLNPIFSENFWSL